MRVSNTEHASRPWRIHEFVHDFELEDVWALPLPRGKDGFTQLTERLASLDPTQSSVRVIRVLWSARWKIGGLLRWEDKDAGVGSRVSSVRERLPKDLSHGPHGPQFKALPFTPLYLTEDEWAAEIANRTMHGVMHLGRVRDQSGEFQCEMAVYVKPNGHFGRSYMALIRPLRRFIVYPVMIRRLREWADGGALIPKAFGQPTELV